MAIIRWSYYLLVTFGVFPIIGPYPYVLAGENGLPALMQKVFNHIEIPCLQSENWPSICWIIAIVAFLVGILLRRWWDQSRKE